MKLDPQVRVPGPITDICWSFSVTMASDDIVDWSGGNRCCITGNENNTLFTINMEDSPKGKVPERLLKYKTEQKKQLTAEEISQRQQEAANRKKIQDDHRAKQARKVREEVMRFDRAVQSRLQAGQPASGQQESATTGQWYKSQISKKPS